MIYFLRYLLNLFSLISIFINVALFLGSPGEALSERCGRHHHEGTNEFYGVFMRKIIDTIFFFDKLEDPYTGEVHGHCVKSHLIEITSEVF